MVWSNIWFGGLHLHGCHSARTHICTHASSVLRRIIQPITLYPHLRFRMKNSQATRGKRWNEWMHRLSSSLYTSSGKSGFGPFGGGKWEEWVIFFSFVNTWRRRNRLLYHREGSCLYCGGFEIRRIDLASGCEVLIHHKRHSVLINKRWSCLWVSCGHVHVELLFLVNR